MDDDPREEHSSLSQQERGGKYRRRQEEKREIPIETFSTIESAMETAAILMEKTSDDIEALSMECFELKKHLKYSKQQAKDMDARHQEALEREKKAIEDVRDLEAKLGFLEEEYRAYARVVAQLEAENEKEKTLNKQIEERCKEVKKAKEKILAEAANLRNKSKALEESAKEYKEIFGERMEKGMKKYTEDIQMLDDDKFELKSKLESFKRASLQRGIKGGESSYRREGKGRQRECVMCLSEENNVLFTPCAHIVLCAKCNDVHEAHGMRDCPSCRAPIQRRIKVRYANSIP